MRSALVNKAIDAAAVLAEVAASKNGAAVLFVGAVRDSNDGRDVSGIEYSAYVAMAESEMAVIVSEAAAEFDTDDIVVEHRVGRLGIGEASVVIAVAHPHRAQAYEASRFIIEALKKRVPVWKREDYLDGTTEWVDPTTTQQAAGR